MKKLTISFGLLAVCSAILLSSCAEKVGTEPGNDPDPVITIYQYAPSLPYNSDNDVSLRFVANNKVESGYYFVESTEDKEERVESLGESGYTDYVISNGTELEFDEATNSSDVIVTDLIGEYTITAVAVNSSKKNPSKTTFLGLTWDEENGIDGIYDLSEGEYVREYWNLEGEPTEEYVETSLQMCTTDSTLWRFKNLYGEGYSLKIQLLPDYTGKDADGTYTFFRVTAQPTGWTYGDYGTVYVRDVGYWQGNDAYVTDYGYESGMYEDGSCFVMVEYYVSAGALDYWYDYFFPYTE